MKYSELTDCPSGCPVYKEGICTGGYTCYGGEPIEPPCTMFESDTDLDEWISSYHERQKRFDEAEDRRFKKDRERQERNAIAKKRRMESAWEVRSETREIKSLKKRISGNEADMRLSESLCFAVNITNEMFRYSERVSTKNEPILRENERMRERIAELEAIKKCKLQALNKRRRNERTAGGQP